MIALRPRVLLLAATLVLGLATSSVAAARWLVAPVDDGVITLLLLGADAGPPRGGTPTDARADGFHLLFVSEDRQHATFLNIPRDSWVEVPGMGRTKINACLTGGPERCVSTVESLFGIEVDHHLVTSMHGLADAFEQLGGLDMDVPRALSGGGPDIRAGQQHLNGYEVLTYARDRKSRPHGDFDRTQAQAEVLVAAHAQTVQGADLATVARVVAIVSRHTITDASPADILRYGLVALQLPPENVANITLPGNVGTAGKASVVRLSERAGAIVRDAAEDGRVGSD